LANPAVAATAASQRSKAAAAATMAGSTTPDLAANPSTAKSALLGPT